MNQEKKHPTLEELLREDKVAKKLRLRKIAAIIALTVPIIIIGLIWASAIVQNYSGQFFMTGLVVFITGCIAAGFATEFGDSLPL